MGGAPSQSQVLSMNTRDVHVTSFLHKPLQTRYHRAGQPTERDKISWHNHTISHRDMSQHNNVILVEQEGRIELALKAYRYNQFKSLQRAAEAYNVPNSTLAYRASGRSFRPQITPNCRKLSLTEEHTIVQYILDLDPRGFAPRLCEVADMADKQLDVRVESQWGCTGLSDSYHVQMS